MKSILPIVTTQRPQVKTDHVMASTGGHFDWTFDDPSFRAIF